MRGYVLIQTKSIKLEWFTKFLTRFRFGFMEYILVHEVSICLYMLELIDIFNEVFLKA